MTNRAHVDSLEAIESFRAALIVYLSKSRQALEVATGEIVRTRLWLETDRRIYWENHVRRCTKELELAHEQSRLPEMPSARAALNDLLIRIRLGGRSLGQDQL